MEVQWNQIPRIRGPQKFERKRLDWKLAKVVVVIKKMRKTEGRKEERLEETREPQSQTLTRQRQQTKSNLVQMLDSNIDVPR